MQLEMGMSTRRYLPARGTAGLARSLVSGKSRVPAPPPIITDSTLLVLGDMRLPCVIAKKPFSQTAQFSIPCSAVEAQAGFCGSLAFEYLNAGSRHVRHCLWIVCL